MTYLELVAPLKRKYRSQLLASAPFTPLILLSYSSYPEKIQVFD